MDASLVEAPSSSDGRGKERRRAFQICRTNARISDGAAAMMVLSVQPKISCNSP
ncbi:MAG: hypothetical protein IPI30_12310 [Saprospiraceae bacterium]|nr:hypothetical protein [Candidatus Vicinibacter affinis]